MNLFKRALTSIIRTPVKSMVLFSLIFILGTAVSGAISVRNAIHTTDLNLRRNMRPVVVLDENWERIDDSELEELMELSEDRSMLDSLYEVGNLSYVEHFDYSMRSWMSSLELSIWHPIPEEIIPAPNIGHTFDLQGVSASEFIDIRQGFVEIVEGESFSEVQLLSGEAVVVISIYLAEKNGLAIGDSISLDITRPISDEEQDFVFEVYSTYQFEIIGLFDVIGIENIEFSNMFDRTIEEARLIQTANQIYLPNGLAREINETTQHAYLRFSEEQGAEFDWDSLSDTLHLTRPVFVLYDPLDLDNFREAAQSILGDQWHLSDGSNRFAPLSASMEMMRRIADGILLGVSISAIVILGLVITLFLYDRRHEIGVYLALGERKKKIVGQLLTEISILALLAITASLFVGTLIANQLSEDLLQSEISGLEIPVREALSAEVLEPWEIMGLPPPMSGEEMLEFYDASLSGMTVLIFYVVSLVIVTLSTSIPIIYVTRLSPKKVLM